MTRSVHLALADLTNISRRIIYLMICEESYVCILSLEFRLSLVSISDVSSHLSAAEQTGYALRKHAHAIYSNISQL